jgi:trk system potassium uptake protein TrkA
MTQDLDVIVAGGGRVGFQTAELLADHGHDVTIVERDEERCDAIADEWVATVITGDATHPNILEQAGLDSADAVAALTGETGMNLAICMAASDIAPGIRTVARIDRGAGDAYERFVDAVVFPERAGARVAASEIVGPDVEALSEMTGDLDILNIRVAEDAPAAGKTLTDVRFPAGTLVVSAGNGDRVARPDTELVPGEQFVVAVEPGIVDEVMRLLRG